MDYRGIPWELLKLEPKEFFSPKLLNFTKKNIFIKKNATIVCKVNYFKFLCFFNSNGGKNIGTQDDLLGDL
jgi:hypothetical protein